LSAMKAITLRHPWPWAVCCLGKDVENRTWIPSMKIGERFAIHGGRWPIPDDGVSRSNADNDYANTICMTVKQLADAGLCKINPVTLAMIRPYCGIVALATFGGITRDIADSPWHGGHLAWWLREVQVLCQPIAIRGAQGLWVIPDWCEKKLLTFAAA
jgi:hypothetical protein